MFLVKNYESCQEEVLTSTSDPYPTEILQQNPCSDPDWTLIFRLRIAKLLTYLLTYILGRLLAYPLTYLLTYLHTYFLTCSLQRNSGRPLLT